MREGAYDYIEKPFRVETIAAVAAAHGGKSAAGHGKSVSARARERGDAARRNHRHSAKIQDVLRMVSRLKDIRTPVLITGESGTGKELVARAIHFRGPLAPMPFVAVDCGSLVPTLMESELFGHEKGAFTGALKSKAGLFQAANGGTIFLDEIGELPLEMQAKLLRVLQEKEVRPVGSNDKSIRGCARDRRHESRSRSGLSRGNVSQGSLFPAERRHRPSAEPARAPLRYPAARALLSGPLCAGRKHSGGARRDEKLPAIRLAGKRARARELHRPRRGAGRSSHHRCGGSAARDSRRGGFRPDSARTRPSFPPRRSPIWSA